MAALTIDLPALRGSPTARRVAGRWRALTGGAGVRDRDRRTLAACSGGADSTALVLALAGASTEVVVAHIVHDLRSPAETAPERDRVAALASALGLGFTGASVAVRAQAGNTEANARRERYRELERLALEAGCPFVATAHHAGDQLETMLMAMLRGAGPRGLAGIPPRRRLGDRGVHLVRPLLGVSRDEAEALCVAAGVPWSTDPTNADISRLRAALRAGPAPSLARLRPGALAGIGQTAANLRDVASLLDALAADMVASSDRTADGFRWPRAGLRGTHAAVLSEGIRRAHALLHEGRHGDRLPARALRAAVTHILSGGGEPRRFVWRATELIVDPHSVALRRTAHG